MEVIAADSSAAILDTQFEAVSIVATAAILVRPPYREPSSVLARPLYADANRGYEVVIDEAILCRQLLEIAKADIIHLDMSLGAFPVEQLSPIQFSSLRVSSRGRRHLMKVLPRLRKISGEVKQRYGIEVLAIGKESIPVRIAELTAGAHAILYTCDKALTENKGIFLGLPSKCQARIHQRKLYLYSLMASEHDIRGVADDRKGLLEKTVVTEMLNPVARGFRVLRITPGS